MSVDFFDYSATTFSLSRSLFSMVVVIVVVIFDKQAEWVHYMRLEFSLISIDFILWRWLFFCPKPKIKDFTRKINGGIKCQIDRVFLHSR